MGRPFMYSKILAGVSSGAVFVSVQANSVSAVGEATFYNVQDYLKSLCGVDFKSKRETYWNWIDFCVKDDADFRALSRRVKFCTEFLESIVTKDGYEDFFKEITNAEKLNKKLKSFKMPEYEGEYYSPKGDEGRLQAVLENVKNYLLAQLAKEPNSVKRFEKFLHFKNHIQMLKEIFKEQGKMFQIERNILLLRKIYNANNGEIYVDSEKTGEVVLVFNEDCLFNTHKEARGTFYKEENYFEYKCGNYEDRFPVNPELRDWILKTIGTNNTDMIISNNLMENAIVGENKDRRNKISFSVTRTDEQKISEEAKDKEFLNKKHYDGDVSDEEWKDKFTQSMGKKTGTINVASKQNFVKNKKEEDCIDLDEENNDESIKNFDNKKADKKVQNAKKGQDFVYKFSDEEKQLAKYTLDFMDMDDQSKLFRAINGLKNSLQNNNNRNSEMVLLADNSSDKKQDLYKFYDLERKNAFSKQKIEGLKYKSNEFIPSLPF